MNKTLRTLRTVLRYKRFHYLLEQARTVCCVVLFEGNKRKNEKFLLRKTKTLSSVSGKVQRLLKILKTCNQQFSALLSVGFKTFHQCLFSNGCFVHLLVCMLRTLVAEKVLFITNQIKRLNLASEKARSNLVS